MSPHRLTARVFAPANTCAMESSAPGKGGHQLANALPLAKLGKSLASWAALRPVQAQAQQRCEHKVPRKKWISSQILRPTPNLVFQARGFDSMGLPLAVGVRGIAGLERLGVIRGKRQDLTLATLGAKLGLDLKAPEAVAQPGALVGDYAVKTEVATSDLTRTHRAGGSVVVVAAGALMYTADEQGNLVRADGTGPTSYTFDVEGNAINAGLAPSGSGVVTDNTIFGGEVEDTIYGLSGNDFLMGGGGVDTVDGGIGSDLLFGGAGADFLNGGDGNDFLMADYYSVSTGRQLLGGGDNWVNWGVPQGREVKTAGRGWGAYGLTVLRPDPQLLSGARRQAPAWWRAIEFFGGSEAEDSTDGLSGNCATEQAASPNWRVQAGSEAGHTGVSRKNAMGWRTHFAF